MSTVAAAPAGAIQNNLGSWQEEAQTVEARCRKVITRFQAPLMERLDRLVLQAVDAAGVS